MFSIYDLKQTERSVLVDEEHNVYLSAFPDDFLNKLDISNEDRENFIIGYLWTENPKTNVNNNESIFLIMLSTFLFLSSTYPFLLIKKATRILFPVAKKHDKKSICDEKKINLLVTCTMRHVIIVYILLFTRKLIHPSTSFIHLLILYHY